MHLSPEQLHRERCTDCGFFQQILTKNGRHTLWDRIAANELHEKLIWCMSEPAQKKLVELNWTHAENW